MKLSDSKKNIARNLCWAVLGKVVTLLSGFFVGIMVARYLGPKQYGLMNYVISYVFLFQTFSVFGLDSIEIREEAKNPSTFETIIGSAFVLRLILSTFFIFLVIFTSIIIEADWDITLLVSVYSLTIALNSFSVIRNYFTSIVQNEYIVKTEISRTIIGVVIKVTLLLQNATLIWFIAASMFDFFLLASGYVWAYKKRIGSFSKWKYDLNTIRFLIKESFPLMLSSTAVIVYQRIDQIMIGKIIDKEAVGFFSVASRFVEILIYVPMILAQTITPVLVSIMKRNKEEYERKGQIFMNLSLWSSLLLGTMMSVCSYWLILYTFGEKYIAAATVLQIMSFKAASVALSNTAGSMLVAEGLQKWAIGRDLFGCLVCLVCNWYFLPIYGIVAAAWIAILSNISAGYLADFIIPAYHHLFYRQTRAIVVGWKDLINIKTLIQERRDI